MVAANGPSTASRRAFRGGLPRQDRACGFSPLRPLGNAERGKSCNPWDMNRWGVVALAYALLGTMAVALAFFWRHTSPWVHPAPWLSLADGAPREGFSLVLGVALGGLVVVATRLLVGRVEFARRLHSELRPLARSMSSTDICLLAIFSALGEELLFRGLLQPWLGLFAQAAIFGGLHQVGGPSRWVWMSWATLMGLLLGCMYALTGSLVGPIAAHALVNGVNLFFLKRYDPRPAQRRMGGLLGIKS